MARTTASLDKIAYNILNQVRGGQSFNEEDISLRQIKFAVKYYRALLIRRDLQRPGLELTEFEQSLGQVEHELKPSSDFGLDLLQSKQEIPDTVRIKGKPNGLTFVGLKNGNVNYPIITYHRAKWIGDNKYTQKGTRCYLEENKTHIFGEIVDKLQNRGSTSKEFEVKGIFEDPEQVIRFSSPNSEITGSEPFPCSKDMIQRITQSLISGEIKLLIGSQAREE